MRWIIAPSSSQAHAEHLAAEASGLEQLLDGSWQQLQAALLAAGLDPRDEAGDGGEDSSDGDDVGSDQATE